MTFVIPGPDIGGCSAGPRGASPAATATISGVTGERLSGVGGGSNPLASGREAVRRHAWADAFELLSRADADDELGGADLEALAEAAYFSAQGSAVADIRDRAFKA